MENHKMNRTIVGKSTFKEADDHTTYFKDKTALERLNAACDIINSIFNSNPTAKVDKTIYSVRKHAKSI